MAEQAPPGEPIPDGLTPTGWMERKLLIERGRKLYIIRGKTIELVFGQIKEVLGFARFLGKTRLHIKDKQRQYGKHRIEPSVPFSHRIQRLDLKIIVRQAQIGSL